MERAQWDLVLVSLINTKCLTFELENCLAQADYPLEVTSQSSQKGKAALSVSHDLCLSGVIKVLSQF